MPFDAPIMDAREFPAMMRREIRDASFCSDAPPSSLVRNSASSSSSPSDGEGAPTSNPDSSAIHSSDEAAPIESVTRSY